ncbi:MAG: DUF4918 family protein [Flavobacteriales bacterium]|nr:DUF4918 family protein [Flavobacteriales bacterium]
MISDQILEFLLNLKEPRVTDSKVEVLNPFLNPETKRVVAAFYNKYYSDENKRLAFIGINPGRYGSGLTGIGFTDPVNLAVKCQIENALDQKSELSSRFVYEVIDAFGGLEAFYNHIYITSVVPLGFTRNGINLNYYDDKELENKLRPYIKAQIKKQLPFLRRDVAFCIGKGKNQKFLEKLNREERYFKKLEVLPHPRWVMQYKLKQKESFIQEFISELSKPLL